MLEEKDLQALRAAIREETADIRSDLAGVKVRLDLDIEQKFNLLAEGQKAILEAITPRERIEAVEADISVLKMAIRTLTAEIAELKKAQ